MAMNKKEREMNSEMMKEFSNPGSIYRGAPFWAWNNRLDADQLCRQIDCFKEMGLGGFHMHPRTGMDTEYLSDEFFSMIRACRDHAEKTGMLAWGPLEHTREEREERDSNFRNLIFWLLYGFTDFDFISEALLPTQKNDPDQKNDPKRNGFAVGEMAYDVILVPGLRTIRATTLKRLEEFATAGGRVIFAGEVPNLVDAEPSEAPAALAARCETIPFQDAGSLCIGTGPRDRPGRRPGGTGVGLPSPASQ